MRRGRTSSDVAIHRARTSDGNLGVTKDVGRSVRPQKGAPAVLFVVLQRSPPDAEQTAACGSED